MKKMTSRDPSRRKPSAGALLKGFPKNIREIAGQLRTLVKHAVPDANEEVKIGWRLIGYRAGLRTASAYFAFIAPSQDKVELGFEYGTGLSDPHHLLNKKLKQVHSIVVRNIAEIKPQPMSELIHQAAVIAREKKELRNR